MLLVVAAIADDRATEIIEIVAHPFAKGAEIISAYNGSTCFEPGVIIDH